MGKGDSRTRRGKIFKGSTGKFRTKKKSEHYVAKPDQKKVVDEVEVKEAPKAKAKAPVKKAAPKKSPAKKAAVKKTDNKKAETKKATVKKPAAAKAGTKKAKDTKSEKATTKKKEKE